MAMDETSWPGLRFGVIGEAWRLYRRHWQVWSLTMLVAFVCASVAEGVSTSAFYVASRGMLGGLVGVGARGPQILPVMVGAAIGGFFAGGMMRMAVNQVRGRAPRLEDLFSVTDVWFDLVLGSALLGLVLAIGYELLVIPGLIAAGLLMMMYPLIVDGGLPATGAMIQSFHALKSQWLLAAFVHLAITIVAGLGIVFFGVGILVTGPLYALSVALIYRDLFLSPYSPTWAKPHKHFEDD